MRRRLRYLVLRSPKTYFLDLILLGSTEGLRRTEGVNEAHYSYYQASRV